MEHLCLSGANALGDALKKCPFLHNLAQTHGPEYASSLAIKPTCLRGHGNERHPLLTEEYDGNDFTSNFALFHGRGGVLPLPPRSTTEPKVLYPLEHPRAQTEAEGPRCPFSTGTPASDSPSFIVPLFAAAPLASMSMSWGSNWFNIHHLFQRHLNQHRAQQRKPPQQPQQINASQYGGAAGPGLGGPGSANTHNAGTTGGGKCPLRRALGPLAGIVFNQHGHLSCPEPIVKMRSALAATRPVRELRPQALPIKLLAVAMTTAVINVPCGMWREHTEKFSSQWFIAVHATIPFIAMLRKAVIMPKYAILFTICAAIAGQAMGAKLERRRIMAAAKDELGGLAKASVATATSTSRPVAAIGRQPAALPVASLLMSSQPLDRSAMPAPVATHGSVRWMAAQDGDGLGFGAEGLPCGTVVATGHGTDTDRLGQLQFRVGKMRTELLSVGMRRGAGSRGSRARLLISRDPQSAPAIAAMAPMVTC